MKISLTTFEHRICDWLLDLLHSQWRALGVPTSAGQAARAEEAIDPEALLWCSLEFFPSQPRLKEQVLAWWSENSQGVLVPRIRKFAQGGNDPRELIWHALDKQWRRSPKPAKTACYGQKSVDELKAFCADLERDSGKKAELRQQPGKAEKSHLRTQAPHLWSRPSSSGRCL
jgi:hypothetical protein